MKEDIFPNDRKENLVPQPLPLWLLRNGDKGLIKAALKALPMLVKNFPLHQVLKMIDMALFNAMFKRLEYSTSTVHSNVFNKHQLEKVCL